MTINRRDLITGLVSLVAAPAIVRVSSIMPVPATSNIVYWTGSEWTPFNFNCRCANLELLDKMFHDEILKAIT